jgi:hypothetical protein
MSRSFMVLEQPTVIGHAGGMDSVGTGDERSYLPKVVFDQ